MTKLNPWKPVITTTPRSSRQPHLRVWDRTQGGLNKAARLYLFGETGMGKVVFEHNDEGRFSIVSSSKGTSVNRTGRVLLTPITKLIGADERFTIVLREDNEFGMRLVFDKVQR